MHLNNEKTAVVDDIVSVEVIGKDLQYNHSHGARTEGDV